MPRVRGLTEKQRIADKKRLLSRKCKAIMSEYGIKQTDVAELTGVTNQAVSYQLNSGNLQTETLIAIVTLSDMPGEDLKRILTAE